jgi:hypothetical protein
MKGVQNDFIAVFGLKKTFNIISLSSQSPKGQRTGLKPGFFVPICL